jgi:hypothetical protein
MTLAPGRPLKSGYKCIYASAWRRIVNWTNFRSVFAAPPCALSIVRARSSAGAPPSPRRAVQIVEVAAPSGRSVPVRHDDDTVKDCHHTVRLRQTGRVIVGAYDKREPKILRVTLAAGGRLRRKQMARAPNLPKAAPRGKPSARQSSPLGSPDLSKTPFPAEAEEFV